MNLHLSICLLILTAIPKLQTAAVSRKHRIVAGQEATAGMFPFAAAIHTTTEDSRFFCGGALLGNQWIITAAQCVDKATSFTIQLGSNSLTKEDPDRVTVATSTYYMHPDYNSQTLDNDIALIHLRMPVELSDYIKSIYTIAVSDIPAEWRVLSLGWGQVNDTDPELSENMNWVALTTLSNDECKITYGNQISDRMLCAAGNYNEGLCIGDTGTPLVTLGIYANAFLYGIASFMSGNGCETPDPSGFTRVYPFSDWIVNITGIPPR